VPPESQVGTGDEAGNAPADTLRRLRDESEIRNCVARIAHTADSGHLEEYLDLFTSDASWEMEGNRRVGRADLRAGAEQRRRQGMTGPGSATRHVITTLSVQIDGSDVATAVSNWIFLTSTDGPPQISLAGQYRDTFRRTPAGWKLSRRVIEAG
jgi:uncharacterized protein (TIGR02246 family)